MDLETQLLDLEQQFWSGDAAFYRQNLTDDALMVFPEPVGLLDRDQIVDAIDAGPRWKEVRFDEMRLLHLTDAIAILITRARARRPGPGSEYATRASSVYVSQDGAWKLAFHQQTPGATD